ncbi:DUF6080 domain-containing protein [Leyella stercorea]|uniref:Uncharacterized protein n=1 Tax=Leyella stercorea CAG:629 TaxID=1263103 RepID=R7H1S6_9BACT|nr:DUF6080 domain-containing protein [Leyella stercorea]CDE32958.1 putative uncharacterized protein [Leyella stercorea CAG:629]
MQILRKEERPIAVVALVVFAALNALLIANHWQSFTRGAHVGFWSVFYNHLNMSGYDIFSLIFISCMRLHWNTLRHPLFVVVLLPLFGLNRLIMPPTEFNAAVLLMAALLVAADVWGAVLMHRLLRDVVEVRRVDAALLTALFYGFAHVMIATMVPDHFALSLPLLLLTLLIAGRKLKEGKPMKLWQSALLFFLTAGVTLTNGVKVALAAWFVNGRKVFSWRSIAAFVVPTLLLGAIYVWQQDSIVAPQERKIKRIEAAVAKKDPARIAKLNEHNDFVKQQNGEALTKDVPLLEWSDITTDRWQSAVDNLFGESLQLHRDYLLEDVQQTRPVFVQYRSALNYVVEVLLVVLLAVGAWTARREKFFLMVLAWFGFDMLMHMGFGFGLNEVYIMTAHWAFIIPIAIGYILRRSNSMAPRVLVAALTVWLWAYNAAIVIGYL